MEIAILLRAIRRDARFPTLGYIPNLMRARVKKCQIFYAIYINVNAASRKAPDDETRRKIKQGSIGASFGTPALQQSDQPFRLCAGKGRARPCGFPHAGPGFAQADSSSGSRRGVGTTSAYRRG